MGAYLTCVLFSVRRNITGTVYFTRTASPFCVPGFHLGMALITRTASLSSSGSIPRSTLALAMLPSFSTTNCTVTRPCVPFFMAASGYLMFLLKYSISTGMPPPGNSGICSTTSKIGLSRVSLSTTFPL